MPVTVTSSTTAPTPSVPGSKGALLIELATSREGSGTSVAFPDVCKVPSPPAPFVAAPYPNSQYQENLRKANKADAGAQTGNKKAQADVAKSIKGAADACRSLGQEAQVSSATQAVMIGRTLHYKYIDALRLKRK